MRSARLATSSVIAQIHYLVPFSDEKARFFLAWWQRMHENSAPLVAVSLKLVEWATNGGTAQRFVWEVCRWPQRRSSSWTFVCWMIDGDGMWMRSFSSKKSALNYFAQSPTIVMAHSQSTDDGGSRGQQIRGAM